MKAHLKRLSRPKSGTRPPFGRSGRAQIDGAAGTSRQPAPPSLPKIALLWDLAPDSPAWGPLRAAERLGLALRTVVPQELSASVGALCGIPDAADVFSVLSGDGAGSGAEKGGRSVRPAKQPDGLLPAAQPRIPAGPALVLCGLPQPEREALLDALRAAGAVIPLKAIVTPTNQSWRFAELLAELAREHAALHGAAR